MGILSGNPKDEPMHDGEIFGLWNYSSMAKLSLAGLQAYANHAGDKDLKQLIRDMLETARQESAECDRLLKDNGIAPAPFFPEKPAANTEDIPPGAKFADAEIAAALAAGNNAALMAASGMIASSIREDIGAMFAKFHGVKTTYGLRLLRLNKEKGWLVPPPLQVKRPEPVHA